tara:strand:- start:1344 stop:2081 length:738 start_codon:yes stop_codon:yes gene_type:complete
MKINYPKILITGSSSGIGFFLAKEFSKKNYRVIINGRNKKKLSQALKKIKNSDSIEGDMSDLNEVKKNFDKIKKKYNSLDAIIANLGNSDFKKNNKDIDFSIKNNLMPAVHLVENAKLLLKKNSKIICISSICGAEVIEGAPLGYSVAKAALNFYVKSVSRELSKSGISINAILPGNIMFNGSTWQKKIKNDRSKTLNYINNKVPSKKFGTPYDIFLICEMLCKNKSGFINGSILKVDGGQTLSI